MQTKSLKIIILSLVVVILVILGWAPWLTNAKVREIITANPKFKYQYPSKIGPENLGIHVLSTPFCRWVTTYEGGWFVCFWQGLKNNSQYNDRLVQSIKDGYCKKYYDGCNTCEKMGIDEVCTEKYCSEFDEPKCLDEIKKYSSAQYGFQYSAGYVVEESKELPFVLVVRGSKGRVEIFKNSDFKDPLTKKEGVRLHGYSSSGFDEYESELVPKEKLDIGGHGVWLFYRKGDAQTMEEVRGIFTSIQVK